MDREYIADRTVDIVTAYLAGNVIDRRQIGEIISDVACAISAIGEEPKNEPGRQPAIDPSKSIKRDHIISLIDGRPYKLLKRHLRTHGLTPDQYREIFALPSSYPMVAPAYREKRSALAKDIGLGRKPAARRKAA